MFFESAERTTRRETDRQTNILLTTLIVYPNKNHQRTGVL